MDIQHIAVPEAGKDYPRNWNEFLNWFGSEEACLAYLEGFALASGLRVPELRSDGASVARQPWDACCARTVATKAPSPPARSSTRRARPCVCGWLAPGI